MDLEMIEIIAALGISDPIYLDHNCKIARWLYAIDQQRFDNAERLEKILKNNYIKVVNSNAYSVLFEWIE